MIQAEASIGLHVRESPHFLCAAPWQKSTRSLDPSDHQRKGSFPEAAKPQALWELYNLLLLGLNRANLPKPPPRALPHYGAQKVLWTQARGTLSLHLRCSTSLANMVPCRKCVNHGTNTTCTTCPVSKILGLERGPTSNRNGRPSL